MKLVVIDTKYLVKDNIVKCCIKYCVKFEDGTKSPEYKAFGNAKCNKEDKFDFEIGRKIALARAESKAYKVNKKICNDMINDYTNKLKELIPFKDKAIACIEHNKEYINGLSK